MDYNLLEWVNGLSEEDKKYVDKLVSTIYELKAECLMLNDEKEIIKHYNTRLQIELEKCNE